MPRNRRVRAAQDASDDRLRKQGQSSTQISRQVAADLSGLTGLGGDQVAIGHVMRLQRSAGNAAAARYVMRRSANRGIVQRWKPWASKPSKKQSVQHQKQLRQLTQHGNVTVDEDDLNGLDTISGGTGDALGYGADLTGAPADSFGNFGSETERLGDSKWDEDKKTGDKPIRFLDPTGQDQLGAVGSGIGAGGAALGAVGGGLGAAISIYKLVQELKKAGPIDKAEVSKIVMDVVGGLSNALFGGGQVVSGTTQSIAQGIASTGNDVAGTVSDAASGVTESLGGLGGMIEAFLGLTKGVMGTAQYFMSISQKGWKQGEAIAEIGTDFLKSLKGFMVAGKSILGAANTFMQIAGAGAEFVQAFPVVGAAINIVVQLTDMLITTISSVVRIYKLVKAAVMASKAKKLGASSVQGVKDFAANMVEVNYKRVKRQVIPLISNGMTLFANVMSICGSVLNIVGVATAAAYGAGVGVMAGGYAAAGISAVTKIGAASLSGGQKVVRWGKQEIRDFGKGGTTGKSGQGNKVYQMGKKLGINMDKTSKKKAENLSNQINWLLTHLKSLPDPLPDPAKDAPGFEAAKAQYNEAYMLVKTTGVSVKELTRASSGDEVVKILATAMRKRE